MRKAIGFAVAVGIAACSTTPSGGGGGSSGGPTVTRVGIFWGQGPGPCDGPVTMNFTVEVLNAKNGDAVVSNLVGPGLPGQIADSVTSSDTLIQHSYPVPKGSGSWTATIISVGGQTPNIVPGGSLTQRSAASC